MNGNYPIVIFWSEDDNACIADVPDLRYCSAHGATPEEALRAILIGRRLWLETPREVGVELPDPTESAFLPATARHAQRVAAGAQ
jgi:predicted RNase H-like HicB family nuclease